MSFKFDVRKAVHIMLFTLHCLGSAADMRRLLLLLYLIDRKYLVKYGDSVTGDNYIALKYGPAPYNIMNILRWLKEGQMDRKDLSKYRQFFVFNAANSQVIANAKYNTAYIAASEAEIMFQVIHEYKQLSFDELSVYTCGKAWQSTDENGEIKLMALAEEGGASADVIGYINRSFYDETGTFR